MATPDVDRSEHLGATRTGPRLVRQLVRYVLAVVVVACVAGLLVAQPRRAESMDLAGALARGDVTAYQVGDRPTSLMLPLLRDHDEVPGLWWRDSRGGSHFTSGPEASMAAHLAGSAPVRGRTAPNLPATGVDGAEPDGAATEGSVPYGSHVTYGPGRVEGAGLVPFLLLANQRGIPVDDLSGGWPASLGALFALTWLVGLVLLLGGPQPRRATRWCWFWTLSAPLGVGLMLWLKTEHPWSATAERLRPALPHREQTRQPGGEHRYTGVMGLLVLLLVYFTTTVLLHDFGR